MSFAKLDDTEYATLVSIAGTLGVNPSWLYDVIDFESGWDPVARNQESGARGLIQFMPATARGMGFESADAIVRSFPDRVSQLQGPVLTYLFPYAPFPTQQSIAMAVFYPAFRAVPADTVFPSDVQDENPGITTPADYMKLVFKSGWTPVLIVGGAVVVLAALFFLSQKG